jgi:hypothetical protein
VKINSFLGLSLQERAASIVPSGKPEDLFVCQMHLESIGFQPKYFL